MYVRAPVLMATMRIMPLVRVLNAILLVSPVQPLALLAAYLAVHNSTVQGVAHVLLVIHFVTLVMDQGIMLVRPVLPLPIL